MKIKPWRSIKHKRVEPHEWTECWALMTLSKSQPRLHSMSIRCQVHREHGIHKARYAEPSGATVTICWTDSL